MFLRRLEAAQHNPLLQVHVPILERLGVEGMSSDESDLDELPRYPRARLENPRYYVRRPRWRAEALGDWLRIFDSVHMVTHRSQSGGSRGALPHLRLYNAQSAKLSERESFVRALPINAYEEEWLANKHRSEYTVQPNKDEIYHFVHSNALFA